MLNPVFYMLNPVFYMLNPISYMLNPVSNMHNFAILQLWQSSKSVTELVMAQVESDVCI